MARRKKNTEVLPLLPLRDIVIFPNMVVPFFVGRKSSVQALHYAVENKTELFLCAQKDSADEEPTQDQIFHAGTIVEILQVVNLPDGTIKVLVEGKRRAKFKSVIAEEDFYLVDLEIFETPAEHGEDVHALFRATLKAFENLAKLNQRISPELLVSIQKIEEANLLIDSVVVHLNLKLDEKQNLIEINDTKERIEALLSYLENEIEILQLERRIRSRVKKQMEKGQREYYLNEQMTAIQKELGEQDEFKNEIKNLEEKIKNTKMPKEVRAKAESEFRKLKLMAPMSAEATVLRLYIETLLDLPWGVRSTDNYDLDHAEEILDRDHYGLSKIKERILEFIAVQNLSQNSNGSVLCFVGPPGVGKTSLGSSIANALERNYGRIALGGLRDEAEIRGHRRTYVGAMPGKVVQALKKSGTCNPVILFDEIDKMGSDFRGDPASAMLEVLDPSQNHAFGDHYLEIDVDLSDVMFICTANSYSGIPLPLLDRMEVIELDSYTEKEKLEIATRHLLPKQLKKHGLSLNKLKISKESLLDMIRLYTRESGVRNLDRLVAKVIRKMAKRMLETQSKSKAKTNASSSKLRTVSRGDLKKLLGPPRFKYGKKEEQDHVGLCTGLAWTEVGGETLQIEVSILPGKGKLMLTGKLGEVMQESAQTACSYIRSKARDLGLPDNFNEKIDIHIHLPEGATPKDGPSAGIAITTAVVSALTERPVRSDIAMTGEVTLRGRVLEIGGLKEKLLAAHRAGISNVVIPQENVKDLSELPSEIVKSIKILAVEHVDDVLRNALNFDESDAIEPRIGSIRAPKSISELRH